jgi:hypothetical protein
MYCEYCQIYFGETEDEDAIKEYKKHMSMHGRVLFEEDYTF